MAAKWISETYQDIVSSNTEGQTRQIHLVSSLSENSFSTALNDQLCIPVGGIVCSGLSRPQNGFKAFFYIECGDKRYLGSDRYFFSKPLKGIQEASHVRSYACAEDPSFRAQWKLLGYFKEDSCAELTGKRYDPNFDTRLLCEDNEKKNEEL